MKIKIHCFEGEWSRNRELSIRPLINLLEQAYMSAGKHLTYSYKFCQTIKRLEENLKLDGRSFSVRTYRHCLYFAFHGDGGGLSNSEGDEFISFAQIGEILAHKTNKSILFFGSCGTRTSQAELLKLKNATNAALVVGYGSTVAWINSSLFEVLFFSELCGYQKLGAFKNKMQKLASEGLFANLKVQFV